MSFQGRPNDLVSFVNRNPEIKGYFRGHTGDQSVLAYEKLLKELVL